MSYTIYMKYYIPSVICFAMKVVNCIKCMSTYPNLSGDQFQVHTCLSLPYIFTRASTQFIYESSSGLCRPLQLWLQSHCHQTVTVKKSI